MTDKIWGVVGTEGVFEHAPSGIIAEAWSKYENRNPGWPIKGRPAYRQGGQVYWSDGSPVEFAEESADPS